MPEIIELPGTTVIRLYSSGSVAINLLSKYEKKLKRFFEEQLTELEPSKPLADSKRYFCVVKFPAPGFPSSASCSGSVPTINNNTSNMDAAASVDDEASLDCTKTIITSSNDTNNLNNTTATHLYYVMGVDFFQGCVKVGLLVPIFQHTSITLVGNGGFEIQTSTRRKYYFKPHSMIQLWYCVNLMQKVCASADSIAAASSSGLTTPVAVATPAAHEAGDATSGNSSASCNAATSPTQSPTQMAALDRVLASELELYNRSERPHSWTEDRVRLAEWHRSCEVDVTTYGGGGAASLLDENELRNRPDMSQEERENVELESEIRKQLRNLMSTAGYDLESVTCYQIRMDLEARLNRPLKAKRVFLESEMIITMGQLEQPNQIVPRLFLGSTFNASNRDMLHHLGITHILNMTREVENFYPNEFTYCRINVSDVETENIWKHWFRTNAFIYDALSAGHACLVHCQMGISRSASTVIAYLMKHKKWRLDKARDHVKACRPIIFPNAGFAKQLSLYESMLYALKENRRQFTRSESLRRLPSQASVDYGTGEGGEAREVTGEGEGDGEMGEVERHGDEPMLARKKSNAAGDLEDLRHSYNVQRQFSLLGDDDDDAEFGRDDEAENKVGEVDKDEHQQKKMEQKNAQIEQCTFNSENVNV